MGRFQDIHRVEIMAMAQETQGDDDDDDDDDDDAALNI